MMRGLCSPWEREGLTVPVCAWFERVWGLREARGEGSKQVSDPRHPEVVTQSQDAHIGI